MSKMHGWIFNENVYVAACMEVRRTAFLFGGWLWTAPQSLTEMAVSLYNLFAGAPIIYNYPPIEIKQLKANHHKLILSKLMKKTKLTNCKFEFACESKQTQSAGTKCKHITTLRRSIALRLGPNLRAIAP